MRRQGNQLDPPAGQKGIKIDNQHVGPLARDYREGCADLATGAGVENLNIQANAAVECPALARRFPIGLRTCGRPTAWLQSPAHGKD
jgi:hypothetical protein